MIEGKDISSTSGKLRYGLVGGGPGSFIAGVHKTAIDMTCSAELKAGCFSRNAEKNASAAKSYGIASDRSYSSFNEMAEKEGKRPDKINFVVIATPNDTHYAACRAFLLQGINVSCDKPLCFSVEEATELARIAHSSNLLFMVTYVYTGYPLVHQARELVQNGSLGDIRVIMAEYPQDWLADKVEDKGNPQAQWRTDPQRAGISCCVGDIGTHIENMIHFVTNLEIEKLSATLTTFVDGRKLDDNAQITLKYANGAMGHYWPSQIAVGRENGLAFRIYGTKGALEWQQENPNVMRFVQKGLPPITLTRGGPSLGESSKRWTRMPSGHPEGLFSAWANIYEAFCNSLKRHIHNLPLDQNEIFPTVLDGLRGVKFVHDCVASSQADSAWVDATPPVL